MPTDLQRADTRSISIQAPPGAVLDVVGEPRNLPRWAPEFARGIRADADGWLVDTGAGELRIEVRVSRALGTVDLLRPTAPGAAETGAFARVIANGAGSEFLFTLFFPPESDDAVVESQRAVVDEELRTVRALAETRVAAGGYTRSG
jgi:hypothetical protein